MFIYKNDVDALKAEADELSESLAELAERAQKLSRRIILTTEKPQTISAYFVRSVHRLIGQGLDEQKAFVFIYKKIRFFIKMHCFKAVKAIAFEF